MLKFVNKMSEQQIKDYFITKLSKGEYITRLDRGEDYYRLSYDNKYSDYWSHIDHLYDDKISHDAIFNKDWMLYLYSIFGEEYKQWYQNKLNEQFNYIFSNG